MDERIEELLIKRVDGELSFEEEREIQLWIEESVEHERVYREFETVRKHLDVMRVEFHPDVQECLQIIKKRGKKRVRLIATWMRYVALWVLGASVGGYLFWWNLEDEEKMYRFFAEGAVPRNERAYLVTAGGEKIVIDEGMRDTVLLGSEEKIVRIDSDKVLRYEGYKIDEVKENKMYELVIPRGGEYRVVLEDGTIVWLNSASSLKIPERFIGEERQVYLTGEAYFKVKRDSLRSFCVVTERAKVQVLGTEFNVSAYGDDRDVVTTLVNGMVRVELQKGEFVELKPGEQARTAGEDIEVRKVDVAFETSWITGKYSFDNVRLEELVRQVSRWYDVNISFEEEALKEVRFSGAVLKFRPLEDLIEMIEATSFVQFRVKDNSIIISKR